jgi:hypothetical protein
MKTLTMLAAASLAMPISNSTAQEQGDFTFEQTAIIKHYLQGYSVAYVLRNNTREKVELAAVSCAAYAGDKLVDVMNGLASNLLPQGKTSGTAFSGDGSTRPDRVECGKIPLSARVLALLGGQHRVTLPRDDVKAV